MSFRSIIPISAGSLHVTRMISAQARTRIWNSPLAHTEPRWIRRRSVLVHAVLYFTSPLSACMHVPHTIVHHVPPSEESQLFWSCTKCLGQGSPIGSHVLVHSTSYRQQQQQQRRLCGKWNIPPDTRLRAAVRPGAIHLHVTSWSACSGSAG